MLTLPRLKVAAVQAAPVYLDTAATVQKACELIAEAADNGARLVALPEVFVPGYPYWNWLTTPTEGSEWFERLYRASVEVPGPEVAQICAAARDNGCHVVIGVNERDPQRLGTLYNTNLVISAEGRLLGRHRKLVPTWAEKLTWSPGDGSSLVVYPTDIGPLGTLACGENTNPLARFALLAQGELLHVANYISLPVGPADYDMVRGIQIRAAAHSFEGKLFTIVSCSTISEEMVAELEPLHPDARSLLSRRNSAFSGVIGPQGEVIGEHLIDEEGIIYVDVDLNHCIKPKQMHDIIGGYNRFDIFDLRINRTAQRQAHFVDERPAVDAESLSEPDDPRAIRPALVEGGSS